MYKLQIFENGQWRELDIVQPLDDKSAVNLLLDWKKDLPKFRFRLLKETTVILFDTDSTIIYK